MKIKERRITTAILQLLFKKVKKIHKQNFVVMPVYLCYTTLNAIAKGDYYENMC